MSISTVVDKWFAENTFDSAEWSRPGAAGPAEEGLRPDHQPRAAGPERGSDRRQHHRVDQVRADGPAPSAGRDGADRQRFHRPDGGDRPRPGGAGLRAPADPSPVRRDHRARARRSGRASTCSRETSSPGSTPISGTSIRASSTG